MDTSRERMRAAHLDLSDFAHSQTAPMVMWGGMLRLAGDEPVVVALTAVNDRDRGRTTWRTLWLTDTRLIFSEATKEMGNWSAHSDETDADGVTAWVRRRSDIVAVELTDLTTRTLEWSDGDREWRSGARIGFRDGVPLEVPLFEGRPANQEDRDRLNAFIEAVADLTDRP